MEAFYLEIRNVHVAAILLSGALFFVRAVAGNGFGAVWPMAAPARYLSYSIDTMLLTAALMLMTITRQYPFVDAWLTTKVALIVVYVVLGSFALKRGKTRSMRIVFSAAAAAVFLYIISIAITHNPLGVFSMIG